VTFREQLESAAYHWPVEESRFIRLINQNRCPARLLQRYATELHTFATVFPSMLAQLIKISPEPEVKLYLLENLMEEQGISLRSEVGLRVNPSARHTEWSARFAAAAGVTNQQLDEAASSWKETSTGNFISENRWLEAIGYLLIGIEANLPRTFTAMLPGLQQAGFSERELTFFSAHIVADIDHGETAFQIAEQFATTADQREQVLNAVSMGARNWWIRHNGTTATKFTKQREAVTFT
jgi:pyrroloquinoline-quinone synthase